MPITIDLDCLEITNEPPTKVDADGKFRIHTTITVDNFNILLNAIDEERDGYKAIEKWLDDNCE